MGSDPDSYHKNTRIKVIQSEWINRDYRLPNRLNGDSYIDVTRHEVLTTDEVYIKIADNQNGFRYIAELPQAKFQTFQKRLINTKRLRTPPSQDAKRFIADALQVTPEIMRKLGI